MKTITTALFHYALCTHLSPSKIWAPKAQDPYLYPLKCLEERLKESICWLNYKKQLKVFLILENKLKNKLLSSKNNWCILSCFFVVPLKLRIWGFILDITSLLFLKGNSVAISGLLVQRHICNVRVLSFRITGTNRYTF